MNPDSLTSGSRDIEGCFVINDEHGRLVATFPRDRGDAEHYAQLFATSPDLLDALRSICTVFADVCIRTGYNAGEYYSYRAAQRVLEKATRDK